LFFSLSHFFRVEGVEGHLICPGLILIGLGGIFAFVELTLGSRKGNSHRRNNLENEEVCSGEPEADGSMLWMSWVALLVFGLIAFIIISFLMWLPGPI